MKKTYIIFDSTSESKIEILFEEGISQVDCCYEAPIYLCVHNKRVLLSSDFLAVTMPLFRNQLRKGIQGTLFLPESINADIGYLYNQMLQDKSGVVYKKLDGRDYWVGENFLLWNSELATWLYNDHDGSIIFHVTPIYPGNWDPIGALSYDKWIEQYQTFYTVRLSQSVAQEWEQKASSVVQAIEKEVDSNAVVILCCTACIYDLPMNGSRPGTMQFYSDF